jgi:DNA-binding IclR family transcriptional regulator
LEVLADSAGEAAGLSVPDGDLVHYIEQVSSPNPVSVRDWTGSRIPLHAVSSGQVLLAYSPAAFVQRYLGRPMESFTPRTLVTAEALLERMRAIRRDGYTWALEEFDEGISSVAAPVADAFGEVVAAAHLHGPSYRFPAAGEERAIADEVVTTAARISRSLRQTGESLAPRTRQGTRWAARRATGP